MSGKVTLVGAGPGDPGLLTLKGRTALEEAEVVVFDRLVGPEILSMIPPQARRIDVGKEASHHPVPQEDINRILLEEALAGHRVVRLKGGDPFVFGRGGEELELLARHGVEFEEVPGITSAISAPAYAGIPVTHRDLCSSVHIITGHARAGKALDIDFEALVRTRGTLVFLMGISTLPRIVSGLLAAGMKGTTPAAVVENGTLPTQRRCVATLETLLQQVEAIQIHSPAVIVVGDVCALSARFCWMEQRPLHGKTLVVTRPQSRSGTISRRLRELGAKVWEYPCIETVPKIPCPAMEQALLHCADYEWLVFTSPGGVAAFRHQMDAWGWDGRKLSGLSLAAIGPGTARALAEMGLRADYVPPVYDAAHLGEGLPAQGRVLILRAEEGDAGLTEALQKRAVAYDDIAVYRTEYAFSQKESMRRALEQGEVSAVLFTSASTVRGFAATVGEQVDAGAIHALCIGPQTAALARKYGMTVQMAREATIESLVELACSGCQM